MRLRAIMHIKQKFDHLFDVISSPGFLNKEALGGEIPFFISTYKIETGLEIDKAIKGLINKLETQGVSILVLNLYDITCEILESKGGMDRMFRIEKTKSKAKFLRALQSSINIHQILMPWIAKMIENSDAKVYFITGVGMVYPFIRSHNVLNNLQNIAKDCPTLMFFPGEYDGHSLKLFSLLKDDNYYRAFNIEKVKI